MTVKNTIREFIDARDITPYRFRAEVGIASKTAYDLCNNPEQLPSPIVLTKICDTYQIQPHEILKWEPSHETEMTPA